MKVKTHKANDIWKTPDWLYNQLDEEFHFDFDPCPLNPTFNGLQIEWGQSNFVNPPYSRALKEAFVKKAIEESKKGKTCVLLLPVSTSTKLFHDYILPNKKEIRFIKGRIKFELPDGSPTNSAGTFDSMLIVI